MPPRRRNSPHGVNGREDWLAPAEYARGRPWAYEELLFGSPVDRERAEELAAVVGELETERLELARLHEKLDAHLARASALDRRLKELTVARNEDVSRPASRPTFPHPRDEVDGSSQTHAYDQRSRLLARCEGFDVESPAGPVGFVEGVRFVSRIDRPDLLEVRGGRFGRQLILVPIEQVDEIRLPERQVVLRSAPALTSDLIDELGGRLRRALHFDRTAS